MLRSGKKEHRKQVQTRYTLCGVHCVKVSLQNINKFILTFTLARCIISMIAIAIDHFLLTTTKKFNRYAISRKEVKTMKTTNTTKTVATTNATENKQATFSALLETYASEHEKGTNTSTYTQALENLATAVAYSVLKKCIDTSYNETLVSIRHELTRDKKNIANAVYCSEHATKLAYNSNGDLTQVIVDNDCKKALTTLASATLGDGLDLVNDAIVAILEETEKQLARGEKLDLEKVYTVRRLNKKIWIKLEDSIKGWETVETTPIREIYKAVRRSINSSRALATDPRNGYSYIEDLSKDNKTGETSTIYRRLTKYADLGGYATDYNNACTFYTVDSETVKDTDELLTAMNLTKRQAQILELRQRGYGYKAIATYLGVTQRAVAKTVQAIQTKALAIGLEPK